MFGRYERIAELSARRVAKTLFFVRADSGTDGRTINLIFATFAKVHPFNPRVQSMANYPGTAAMLPSILLIYY